MSAKTDYLENKIINHIFGNIAYANPTQWWLAIYSSNPGESVTGTSPIPLTGRVQITAWTINANEASNTNLIQFPPVPNGATWSVSHFALFDAETGGNALFYGQFNTTKILEEQDILQIAVGQFKVREN